MAGVSVSCLLLMMSGYEHCERYRQKWENSNDPWRCNTGTRLMLPLLAGKVRHKNGDTEPAFIGLTFTARGNTPIDSIQNVIHYLRNPQAPQEHWRTIVISRIPDPKGCRLIPVDVDSGIADNLAQRMRAVLTAPPPPNFEVTESLLQYMFRASGYEDPTRMLAKMGIGADEDDKIESIDDEADDELPDEPPDETYEPYEETDNEAYDELPDETYEPYEEIDDEADDEYPDEDRLPPATPFAGDGVGPEDEVQPPEGPVTGKPPGEARGPEHTGRHPSSVPRESLPYQPSAIAQRLYLKRTDQPEGDEFAWLKKGMPSPVTAAISILLGVLSLWIPQVSALLFLPIGKRAGLKMILGTVFVHSIYYIARHQVPLRDFWLMYLVVAVAGLFLYYYGLYQLYKMYRLKFDLSSAVNNTARRLVRLVHRPQAAVPAFGGMPSAAIAPAIDAGGSITDIGLVLSPFLFIHPLSFPLGTGVVLLCWQKERHSPLAAWNILSVAFVVADLVSEPRHKLLLSVIAALSYLTSKSEHDLTVQHIRQAPAALKQFFGWLVRSPGEAIRYLWTSRPIRREFRFPSVSVDAVFRDLLNRIPEQGQVSILSHLSPAQFEAWMRQRAQLRISVPIHGKKLPQRKFYYVDYVPQVIGASAKEGTEGDGIHPEAARAMLTEFAQILATNMRIVPGRDGRISVPVVCRVSSAERQCALSPIPPIKKESGVILPIGTSYVFYTDDEQHRHYATGLVLDPDVSGHSLIVGASGSGKSVLVRAIVNAAIQAAKVFPLGIFFAEGKSEISALDEVRSPLLTPPVCLLNAQDILMWLSLCLNVLECRQTYHNALCQFLKTSDLPKNLFQRRYGGLPYCLIILDEFWNVLIAAGAVKTLRATDGSGRSFSVPAANLFHLAINRLLILGRSYGMALMLTTQSSKAEIITPAIKANCVPIIGGIGRITPQLLYNLAPDNSRKEMQSVAFELTGKPSELLPGPHCFFIPAPPGSASSVAWLDHQSNVIFGGDLRYPDSPPMWDVFYPFFYPSFLKETVPLVNFDLEALSRDIKEMTQQGLLPHPPVCGWEKAMGFVPFADHQDWQRQGTSVLNHFLRATVQEISGIGEDS